MRHKYLWNAEMRILVWSQYFWPETFHINDVAVTLVQEGHEVIVVTGKPNYPNGSFFDGYRGAGISRELFGRVTVYRLPMLARGSSMIQLIMNYLSFVLSGYFNARRVLRKENFDLVFVYAPSPILQALPAISVAKRAKVPLVIWVQDLWPEALKDTGFLRNRAILKVLKWIVHFIYEKSDLLLAQSEAFKARIAEQVLNPEKVVFFPNSEKLPDMNTQASAAAQELAESMRTCFSVTFTGNLGRAQSVETLICAAKALSEYKDIKFYLVGTGSRFKYLTDQVQNSKLSNVVLVGQYPKEDIPTITQASAVLLLALKNSVIGTTTIPSKLQSYLAIGRPIVASVDGEAARVVLASKSGSVSPAGDGAALASAIISLRALSAEEREVLGANGRAYFEENFNLTAAVKRLVRIFEDVQAKFEK